GNTFAKGAHMAQIDLWRSRGAGVEAAGRGAAVAGGDEAVGGFVARGGLGMERWRIDDGQPDVPLARAIQGRDERGGGAGPIAVRLHLSGALHGPAAAECEGLSRWVANQFRGGTERKAADRAWDWGR